MNKGTLSAATAYLLWGIFPFYFKAIHNVPADQIVAHRIVWSFLFLITIILTRREFGALVKKATWRVVGVYFIAGLLLAGNWLTYVWSVISGYTVEASLGYFINPLFSMLLGIIFFRERLSVRQWLPILLAVCGVAYLTITHGSLPWIALVLAGSFGLYGLMKKLAPLGSLDGLTFETGTIFLLALGYLVTAEFSGSAVFGHTDLLTNILLMLTGVVTAVPLLFFATGARAVPMTTLGLLQFISPTLQFLIGVFAFNEPFSTHQLIGFGLIWLALIWYTINNFRARKAPVPVIDSTELAE